jgi:lactaldehyde reductase
MEFNMPACEAKYVEIAKAMGVDVTGMSVSEGAVAAVEAVKKLSLDLGIPQTFAQAVTPEKSQRRTSLTSTRKYINSGAIV